MTVVGMQQSKCHQKCAIVLLLIYLLLCYSKVLLAGHGTKQAFACISLNSCVHCNSHCSVPSHLLQPNTILCMKMSHSHLSSILILAYFTGIWYANVAVDNYGHSAGGWWGLFSASPGNIKSASSSDARRRGKSRTGLLCVLYSSTEERRESNAPRSRQRRLDRDPLHLERPRGWKWKYITRGNTFIRC